MALSPSPPAANLASAPPRHPKQLLTHIVDTIARTHPKKPYAEIPLSATTYEAGFRTVPYGDLARAVDGMAWWLTRTLGAARTEFETLAYLGPNDGRHNVLVLGAVKAGFKMLFTSPRYSALAQVELMKRLNCRTMLAPSVRPPVTDTILEAYEMRLYRIPELEDLLAEDHPRYPYEKNFEEARSEPLVVLHTSGTTGFPKPIVWTHDWAASFAQERGLAPPSGFDSTDRLMLGVRLFSLMPPFHASHLFGSLFFSIFFGTIVIYPLSGLPPTVQMAADCLEYTEVDIITMVPPYIEELGQNQKVLDLLEHKVKSVMWAGGDVSLGAGNAISSKLKLFTLCGSTEMGIWPTIRRDGPWLSDQWRFMRFHPAMNMAFHHRAGGLFEGYIRRNAESESEQPVFKIFPMLEEYNTGDLFSPHPLDSQLWQHRGRADDMQVFLSGEKYHPTAVEQHIARHPDVQEVLLIGTRRAQAALLLDVGANRPIETSNQMKMIEKLWPVIEEANQMCPAYAKITKQHILFVSPQKLMARSGKGTVQRPATVQLYEEELDEMFEKATGASAPAPPTAHSLLINSAAV